MTWTVRIINDEISSKTIFNCFKHTTLLDKYDAIDRNQEVTSYSNIVEDKDHDSEQTVTSNIDEALVTVYGDDYIRAHNVDFAIDVINDIQAMMKKKTRNKKTKNKILYAPNPPQVKSARI
ncbi:unnamed protein product [Absidia cylindrospora]